MSLVKTDEGKEALRSRDPQLNPRGRQIIVLANGKLSRTAMGQLMEQDIQAEIELLIQCGYLAEGGTIEKRAGQVADPKVVEIASAVAELVVKGVRVPQTHDILALMRLNFRSVNQISVS